MCGQTFKLEKNGGSVNIIRIKLWSKRVTKEIMHERNNLSDKQVKMLLQNWKALVVSTTAPHLTLAFHMQLSCKGDKN
jgi:hypothetical protein